MKKNASGLWVPEVKVEDMPRFTLRTFTVYYSQDIDKFRELVEKEKGYWEGHKQVNFLNYKNQPVGRQYVCIYQFHKDLEMEVLC